MVKSAMLDRTFAALGDPTRRAIVERLTRGEATVTELARPFAMSLPAVLKHIGVLEEAGLMRCAKQGRARRCTLDARALDRATDWIDKRRAAWERRLRALDGMLEKEES